MTSDHEADMNKELRSGEASSPQEGERSAGDSPRFIRRPTRKRGVWRAKKRGEKWAEKWPNFGFQEMFSWVYHNDLMEAMRAPTGFWNLNLPNNSDWSGGYITVPIKFGK